MREAKPDSWIALSDDESRVVGRGMSYGEAVEDAKQNGCEEPVLIKVPEKWLPLVF